MLAAGEPALDVGAEGRGITQAGERTGQSLLEGGLEEGSQLLFRGGGGGRGSTMTATL